MADVAVVILRVVAEIRDVAEGIKENDRQACRLFKRVMAIEPPVLAVQEGTKLSSSESLRQLLATVEKIRNFLERYARTTKFNRALKRKANAAKFTQLGVILTEGMQALQLDVAVDAWAKEDASDRLEDLENMVDMMERMERNRTDNHAEVMGVLKALRNDERAELTGWVEIDYGTDLDFEGSNILGSGAFGEVRTAKWNGVDVAVKHLLVHGLHDDTVRALRKEIRLHSSLHFDHVVQLYAASTIPPNLCLVIELASMGSLWEYLHSTSEPLAHALQTAFLYDIARGMSFLHTKGILHRDLKSANVLVFANRRLKLCDFGLSKIKTESSSRSKRGAVGTAQWMSPEEMDESPANELTDVYSFGVVCFEVATRMEPFKGLKQTQVTRAVADKGKRPQIPEGASASPDVVPLMERCWKQNPAERPEGFGPMVRALASVVSRVGDPRIHSTAAVAANLSSSANRAGIAPSTVAGGVEVDAVPSWVDRMSELRGSATAPPAVGGSVDFGAASTWSDLVSNAAAADPGASPAKSHPTESGRGGDGSTLERSTPQRAAKDMTVVPDAGKMHTPFEALRISGEAIMGSLGAGGSRIMAALSRQPGAKQQPRFDEAAAERQEAAAYTRLADNKWRQRIFGRGVTTLGSSLDPAGEAGMRARANDRALKNLGVRELNLGSLPDCAKIINLPNQVGGHKMMKSIPALLLLEWGGKGAGGKSARFVLKIMYDGGRGLVELGFYEELATHAEGPGAQGKEPERTELVSFLCPYFGAVKVKTDRHTEEDGEIIEPTCMHFLVLKDNCNGFDAPCALDVKMGRVHVEPGEREEKKIAQLKKYPNQPVVGFRYVGMSWSSYFEGDQQPQKLSTNKSWGAGIAVENTGSGLARFFHDGTRLRRGRVKCALRKIRALADFFSRQKIFKFYASSLLLTYDSVDPPPSGPEEEEEVAVCMIDFAHAVPVDGDGELGECPAEAPGDKGYLYGAKNLIGIMEELLEVTAAAPDAPLDVDALSAKLKFMTNVKTNYVDDA